MDGFFKERRHDRGRGFCFRQVVCRKWVVGRGGGADELLRLLSGQRCRAAEVSRDAYWWAGVGEARRWVARDAEYGFHCQDARRWTRNTNGDFAGRGVFS